MHLTSVMDGAGYIRLRMFTYMFTFTSLQWPEEKSQVVTYWMEGLSRAVKDSYFSDLDLALRRAFPIV